MSSSSIGARPDHCDSRCPSTSASSASATTYLNSAAASARPLASWFGGALGAWLAAPDPITRLSTRSGEGLPSPLRGGVGGGGVKRSDFVMPAQASMHGRCGVP